MGAQPQHTQGGSGMRGVDSNLAERALRALLKHHESESEKERRLLGGDLDVRVLFGLARVPENPSPKPTRIDIPHPLVRIAPLSGDGGAAEADGDEHLQEVEACFIVREGSKPWVQEMVSRFPDQLGCVKKVLGLQSLRTKHASFEQRRKLLERFDVFLADDRILPMLTKALGGKFFARKRQPVPVRLTRREALPFAVERCLRSTFVCLGGGTCVAVRAGSTATPPPKLLANVLAICSGVPARVPRGWSNIRSISVKTPSSVALPIYNRTLEELEQIRKMARGRGEGDGAEEEEGGGDDRDVAGKRRRKAASTPLARALKKQKAANGAEEGEEEGEEIMVSEAQEGSSKKKEKKRKDPVDNGVEGETETPTSSKMNTKKELMADSVRDEEEAVSKKDLSSKMPKSLKKKRSKERAEGRGGDTDTAAVLPSNTMTKKKGPEGPGREEGDGFIPSKGFAGARRGYVFRKGESGVGYYIDLLPVVDKARLAALGKKSAKRKSAGSGALKRKKGGGRLGRMSY